MQVMSRRVSSAVLVGRGDERAQLRAAIGRATDGSPATVVVGGEAGVGKTRLVTELGREAEAAGAVVLAGGCLDVDGETLPYAPVVEALRSLPAVVPAEKLAVVLGDARAELARLVPELGGPTSGAEQLTPGRLFELLLGVLHRLADRLPVVLLIEDLHWADQSTRQFLAFLVRNLRRGVLLLLTYRSDELHRRHPLRPFLAELERGGRAERIDLGRLTRQQLADLVAGIVGHEPNPTLLAGVWARSEGNPFFAEELVAAHADGTEFPWGLRDLLLARVEALPDAAQRMLRVGAVAGRRVDYDLLAAVLGDPGEELVKLLREAVTRHVLVAEEPGTGYAFRHALVQEAIYDDLLPGERVPLHAAYARVLAGRVRSRGARATAVELGQLAAHWHAARDLDAALLASIRAAEAAEASYAYAEAQRHYERAVELWELAPSAAAESPLDRIELLRRAAEAAYASGEGGRAIALARLALDGIDQTAQPVLAGALLERLARYHWYQNDAFGNDLTEAVGYMERALALIPADPPSRDRAKVLAAHGQLLMLRSRNAEAVEACTEAIEVARLVGAPVEEAGALASLGAALSDLGQDEAAMAILPQARAVAEAVGDGEALSRAWVNLANALVCAGRCEEAVTVAMEGFEAMGRLGLSRSRGPLILMNAADAHALLGRWDQSDRLLDLAVDPDLDPPSVMLAAVRLSRALARLWRGDAAGVRAELAPVLDRHGTDLPDPQIMAPLCTHLAIAATWEGDLDQARDVVATGLRQLAGTDDSQRLAWLYVAGLEAEAARVELARPRQPAGDPGDVDEARRVAADLLAAARGLAASERPLAAPVKALLLVAEAEWSRIEGNGDPARWAAAATAWDALTWPWLATYARWRQAEAMLAAGRARSEAGEVLVPAFLTAARLGAAGLRRQIEQLATRARIDLPAARDGDGDQADDRADQGDQAAALGLTSRELEVLGLLGAGLSNREIADRLFISPKTASVHVSNLLRKLGAANRVQAGAIAQRLGLDPASATPPATPAS
jgi:DNA-binding CsgD family transcriptional regulator